MDLKGDGHDLIYALSWDYLGGTEEINECRDSNRAHLDYDIGKIHTTVAFVLPLGRIKLKDARLPFNIDPLLGKDLETNNAPLQQ
jgi:hypothetical protein